MTSQASVSFRTGTSRTAEMILGWPDQFVATLKPRLLAVHANSALSIDDLNELNSYGLINAATGRPTPVANTLIDLLVREEWQDRDEFAPMLRESTGETVGISVLEIGCSTGRKLRTLGLPFVHARVGVDVDASAVALGCRLARAENQPVVFSCCSGHSLPFSSDSFDVVVCRNALTYMHQTTVLEEIGRVLRPNGTLFLRYENTLFDLQRLLRPRGVKTFLVHARNFMAGLTLAATGKQISPERQRGGRAFASLGRLGKSLGRAECEIVRVEASQNCPRFLGRSTQTSIVAKKVGVAQSQTHRLRIPSPLLMAY